MGLFKSKKSSQCECGGKCCETNGQAEKESNIKVLGGGCKKCDELTEATKEALKNLGIDESVQHVSDFGKIAAYGVMTTPALVVDEKVVSFGKVLKASEVEELINKVRC